jgi:transcriptional regulator with XRE-family HTH domain
MGEILTKFGKRIRQLRRSKDMTQERLAELANLSLQSVGEIERGRGNTTLLNIENLANALGAGVPALFDFGEVDMTRQDAETELENLLRKCADSDIRAILTVARSLSRK